MKWIYSRCLLALALHSAATPSFCSPANSKTFYSLENARHFQSAASGNFYIQLGSFSQKSNAHALAKKAGLKTKAPVLVSATKNGYYTVKLGPLHTAIAVRKIARTLGNASTGPKKSVYVPTVPKTPVYVPPKPVFKKSIITKTIIIEDEDGPSLPNQVIEGNWFVGAGGGAGQSQVTGQVTVNNGSNLAPPLNQDKLSTQSPTTALIALEGGYRWARAAPWVPNYTLGLSYRHVFAKNVGNQIMQYSLPEFINYDYNWTVSADALLASTKLNLFRYQYFLPYVNAGLGIAFNHTSGYQETPLAGVTPRISPAFGNRTNNALAYNLGAGLDWQLHPQFILSLGYEYLNFGTLNSGSGVGTWSTSSLQAGSYQSNNALLSLNYIL